MHRAALLTAALVLLGVQVPVSQAAPPRVVVGAHGYLFIAQDWTVACQDAGRSARTAASARALAFALAAGGRRSVVVVGPDKSTTLRAYVPATAPSRRCGDASRAALWRALDRDAGPRFLDLRAPLGAAAASRQVYWRKDTHWTPSAAEVYARALTRRLDPDLAARLVSTSGTASRPGDLARVLRRPDAETTVTRRLVNPGVRAVELPPVDAGLARPARHTRATVDPGGRVVPGRTVLVGDSFDDTAVAQLAPLFAEALFLWPGETGADLPAVARALRGADTVVVETVERFAQRTPLLTPAAVDAVRRLPPR